MRALEATFNEQKSEKSPTAYFASLLTTFDGTFQNEKSSAPALGDSDLLRAELYLLAPVAPFTPHSVIRANVNTVLSLIAPLLPTLSKQAPPIRSQLGLYDASVKALDRCQLEVQAVRQSFASILQLCLDPWPKVHKRAVEVIKEVLASPPSPLALHPHPHPDRRVAERAKSILTDMKANALPNSKAQSAEDRCGEWRGRHTSLGFFESCSVQASPIGKVTLPVLTLVHGIDTLNTVISSIVPVLLSPLFGGSRPPFGGAIWCAPP